MVCFEINNFFYLFAINLGLVPYQHCTFAITHPGNSNLTATSLFQLVWHCLCSIWHFLSIWTWQPWLRETLFGFA